MQDDACVCDQFAFEEEKMSFRRMYHPTDERFERPDLQIPASGNRLVSAPVSSPSESSDGPGCGKVPSSSGC